LRARFAKAALSAVFLISVFLSNLLFAQATTAQSAAVEQTCPAFTHNGALGSDKWTYQISLGDSRAQLIHVRIELAPTSSDLRVQLPVWNAVYQVRDFSQYVRNVTAKDKNGGEIIPVPVDKTTWSVPNASTVEYDFLAQMPGPFGAELNSDHAFLNLAMLLMYPVGAPKESMRVQFANVPKGWRIATPLTAASQDGGTSSYCAANYDRLVDSPVEVGDFRESDFESERAHFRVIVRADPQNYSMDELDRMLQKIVSAEITWMADRPFQQYTFIYHFPKGRGRGGMEHAYSAAIEANAPTLTGDWTPLAGLSAHEFFHLWNVKRIRPQSLEPVDYTKENYTRALWFCEGVTSTVAESTLFRAGILEEKDFLAGLAAEIRELETRPAHRTQSAEGTSLQAWLEKYPAYRAPERSISYYNKGELLGMMLNLAILDASGGMKSLRELFQWMNEHYAKQGRYYPDSEGVKEAAEAITGKSFGDFFKSYVSGLKEIPYDDFLSSVGLTVKTKKITVVDPGFTVSANFSGMSIVDSVEPGSDAEAKGIRTGDVLRRIDGEAASDLAAQIASLEPGRSVRLSIQRDSVVLELPVRVGARSVLDYEIVNTPHVTDAQRRRRVAWMRAEAETAAAN
jgi:predicted metalloprotease with PDZ domain